MSDCYIIKQKVVIIVYFEVIIVVNFVVFKLNVCYLLIYNVFLGSSLFVDYFYWNFINIIVYLQVVNGS